MKRNLGQEISNSSEDDNQQILSSRARRQPRTFEQTGISQDVTSDVPPVGTYTAMSNLARDTSASDIRAENTEMKQFATDFLSLYCR